MKILEGIDALSTLLFMDERERPGLILISSRECPPCVKLHPDIAALAKRKPAFVFYDFKVDDYDTREEDQKLTELFRFWKVKYLPSQILLPSNGKPRVICTTRLAVIEAKLSNLY